MKRNTFFCRSCLGLALLFLAGWPARAATETMIDDFESADTFSRWRFYDGHEFPGAKGTFERTADATHAGSWGGKLSFDFAGGGNYVSAYVTVANAPTNGAVRLWLRKPGGHRVKLRYQDQTGQTFQKGFEAPDEQWGDVQIKLTGGVSHWGGAKDGVFHGPAKELGFLCENDGEIRGAMLIDDVRMIEAAPDEASGLSRSDYVATRFEPEQNWRLRSAGNRGASALDGRKWRYDFSQGARWVALSPDEFTLPGTPREFRLRLKGKASGHPVRLELGSHFLSFGRVIGYPESNNEYTFRVPAPPGNDWIAAGGENDNALHGPLRVRSLYLDAAGKKDSGELELIDLSVTAEYPPRRPCLMTAAVRGDGAQTEFVARLRSLLAAPVAATIHWVVRDWDGKVLQQDQKPLTIPANGEPAIFTVPVQPEGRPFLEAEFSADVSNQMIIPVSTCYVAPVPTRSDAALQPESPFGMGLYLYRYGSDAAGLTNLDRAAQLAEDIGVKWSREQFSWSQIEPRKGEYDWTFYDHLVAAAKRHGISLYGLLVSWPAWTKPYTAEGIDGYGRFAAAVAQRYRHDIRHWEIWNEPNIFFWQGPKDQYAQLLQRAYTAIKEANPDAQVLGCSTAQIDLKFIRRTMELGGPFDILTIHPYRASLYDASFVKQLAETAEVVRRPDGSPRPVWITEIGWATYRPHNSLEEGYKPASERRQAELLARVYVDAIAAAALSGGTNASAAFPANVSWYDFRNDGTDPFYAENNLGIMDRQFRPKPAFRAYATLTSLLEGKRFAGRLDLGEGIVSYRFADAKGRTVTALWSIDRNRTAAVPATSPAVRITLMGESRRLEFTGGKVPVALRAEVPVFLSAD